MNNPTGLQTINYMRQSIQVLQRKFGSIIRFENTETQKRIHIKGGPVNKVFGSQQCGGYIKSNV